MTSSPPAPPGTNDQLSPIRSSRPNAPPERRHRSSLRPSTGRRERPEPPHPKCQPSLQQSHCDESIDGHLEHLQRSALGFRGLPKETCGRHSELLATDHSHGLDYDEMLSCHGLILALPVALRVSCLREQESGATTAVSQIGRVISVSSVGPEQSCRPGQQHSTEPSADGVRYP